MASIGISDVVTASVYFEKTRMKKLVKMIFIIIITEKHLLVNEQKVRKQVTEKHLLVNEQRKCRDG